MHLRLQRWSLSGAQAGDIRRQQSLSPPCRGSCSWGSQSQSSIGRLGELIFMLENLIKWDFHVMGPLTSPLLIFGCFTFFGASIILFTVAGNRLVWTSWKHWPTGKAQSYRASSILDNQRKKGSGLEGLFYGSRKRLNFFTLIATFKAKLVFLRNYSRKCKRALKSYKH